jgi:hypothetical protein
VPESTLSGQSGTHGTLRASVSSATLSTWAYSRNDAGEFAFAVMSVNTTQLFGAAARAVFGITNQGTVFVYACSTDDGPHRQHFSSPNTLSLNAWHHVTAVINYAADRIDVYVDGAPLPQPMTSIDFAQDTTPETTSSFAFMGVQDPGVGLMPYNGILDEMRIATVARSPDWIAAQHLSMTDVFVTFVDEEVLP